MLARNLATTTISTAGNAALSAVAGIMLARILGAELLGIYALAILIPNTIYFLGTFGLSTAHIVYAGKYPEKRGAIAFQSFAFAAVIGLLVFAFYAYVITSQPAWFQRFLVVGRFNLVLAAFFVSLQLAAMCLRAGVQGANRILVINISSLCVPLGRVLLIGILLWWLGLGVTGAIAAQLGCFCLELLYMSVATAVEVPIKTWRPDFAFFRKAFSLGFKVQLNNVAWLLSRMVDRYMIAYLMPNSDRALGHYMVAAQFSIMLWVLPQSLQAVFLPHLSVTKSDKPTLAVRTVRILFIALLVILLISAFASTLIPVILGRDYIEAVAPFLLFLPGIFLLGITRPFDSYLTHIEKPMYAAVNSCIGAFVNIMLNLYFIPRLGIGGAALASSMSSALIALMTAGCFKYETGLPLHVFIPRWSDFGAIFGVMRSFLQKSKLSGG